ncbi:MAG: heme NO-binding domain-containing protein [Candidatus Kariarchaeaceae archaeon]|jgi:hypothetical protein
MNSQLDHITTKDDLVTKPDMVEIFEMYVDQEFGHKVWDKLLKNIEFRNLIDHFYPIYGTAVFSKLVDAVAIETNTSVKFLLEDFGVYYRSF